MTESTSPSHPPFDDPLVDRLLGIEENYQFDCKRIKDKLNTVIETIVAFANSDGGIILLGFEDPEKGNRQTGAYRERPGTIHHGYGKHSERVETDKEVG